MEGHDLDRMVLFLAAVRRRSEATRKGATREQGEAIFREHFVGLDEGVTKDASRVEVAAFLGNLRLESGREKWL